MSAKRIKLPPADVVRSIELDEDQKVAPNFEQFGDVMFYQNQHSNKHYVPVTRTNMLYNSAPYVVFDDLHLHTEQTYSLDLYVHWLAYDLKGMFTVNPDFPTNMKYTETGVYMYVLSTDLTTDIGPDDAKTVEALLTTSIPNSLLSMHTNYVVPSTLTMKRTRSCMWIDYVDNLTDDYVELILTEYYLDRVKGCKLVVTKIKNI